jgi:trans-AT polyketide synthase/acyltransferase/oxidoreductase domain-containing protein
MALVFRWYFGHSMRLSHEGDPDKRIDYQIHSGPALGSFNRWYQGTPLEKWRNRHVDEIAEALINGAAEILNQRIRQYQNGQIAGEAGQIVRASAPVPANGAAHTAGVR